MIEYQFQVFNGSLDIWECLYSSGDLEEIVKNGVFDNSAHRYRIIKVQVLAIIPKKS
jgi:hypothetical protein